MKLRTLCLVDQTFQKCFLDWKRFIKEIVNYLNKKLEGTEIKISPTIKKWDTKKLKRTYTSRLLDMEKKMKNYDKIIGFTNIMIFKDYPLYCGIGEGDRLIITNFFPIKIPFLYRYGLKKLTLHELGHTFGLRDSFFLKFSIMDNFFGIFTSKFTKKQIEIIKRDVQSPPQNFINYLFSI